MTEKRLRIVVDSSGARVGSREVENALDGVSASAKKSTDMLGLMQKALAAIGAWKLTGAVQDSVQLAARYETLGVVARRVGENAGYTARQINEVEMALRKTGIAMIESRETISRMVQAQIDLADATKLARIAQDAAVIGGINSSEAFQRMIVGIQTAQVETLRTIGLNVSFEDSYKKLATSLGRKVDQLTAAEKAQARANSVMEAGSRIVGAYEDSLGTAGKQLGSMTRLIDDLKTKLGAFGLEAFTRLVFGTSEKLAELNKKLDELTEKDVQRWARNTADAVGAFGKALIAVSAAYATFKVTAGFGAVLAFMTGPLGVALGLLGGLSAAFYLLKQRQDAAAESARDVAASYGEVMRSIRGMTSAGVMDVLLEEEIKLARLVAERNARPVQVAFDPINRKIAAQSMLLEDLRDKWGDLAKAEGEVVTTTETVTKTAEELAKEYRNYIDALTEGVALGTTTAAESVRLRQELDRERDAWRDTTLPIHERNAALLRARAMTESFTVANNKLIASITGRPRANGAGAVTPTVDLSGAIEELRAFLAENHRVTKAVNEAWNEAMRGIQQAFAAGFGDVFRDGFNGFADFARTIQGVFVDLAAQIAAAMTIEKLGIADIVETLKKEGVGGLTGAQKGVAAGAAGFGIGYGIGGQAGGMLAGGLGGAMGGAAAGFAIAGPAGAAVGALAGLTGGILGAGDAAKKAADDMRALEQTFDNNLWIAHMDAFGTEAERAIARLNAEMVALLEQAQAANPRTGPDRDAALAAVHEIWAERRRQLEEELAAIEAAKRASEERFREDLVIRSMLARGRDEEASALALLVAQSREMAKAIEDGMDPATIAMLQRLHVEEQLAEAQRKATEEAQKALAAQRAYENLDVRMLEAQGLADQAHARAMLLEQEREWQQAVEDGMSAAYMDMLELVHAAERFAAAAAAVEASTRVMEDLGIRALVAQGMGREADIARMTAGHRRERYDAVRGGMSGETLAYMEWVQQLERDAMERQHQTEDQIKAVEAARDAVVSRLDEQLQVARDELATAREQLREQERAVQATQRVVDALSDFADSLLIGPQSTLSPADRLAEARRQYQEMVSAAQGGDRDAASSLPGAAQALLEASRSFNASGAGYVADFDMVRETIDAIRAQYADQLSVEEQMLEQLKAQTEALERQIEELAASREAAIRAAQDQIDALRGGTEAVENWLMRIVAELEIARSAADTHTQSMIDGMRETGGLSAEDIAVLTQNQQALLGAIDAQIEAVLRGATATEQGVLAEIAALERQRFDMNAGAYEQIQQLRNNGQIDDATYWAIEQARQEADAAYRDQIAELQRQVGATDGTTDAVNESTRQLQAMVDLQRTVSNQTQVLGGFLANISNWATSGIGWGDGLNALNGLVWREDVQYAELHVQTQYLAHITGSAASMVGRLEAIEAAVDRLVNVTAASGETVAAETRHVADRVDALSSEVARS